jgi:hypothetical protein
MKKDYIEINGIKYPVEFNMNAQFAFMEAQNLSFFEDYKLNTLRPQQIKALIYEGVVEGCRINNIEFPYSIFDFIAMIKAEHVGKLLMIYASQNRSEIKEQEPEPADVTKKKKFFPFGKLKG